MIEIVTGPIGSGKSVLLNKRMIENAMKGRRIIVNYVWNEEPFYYALRRRGMRSSTADDVLKTTETLRTYEQLYSITNAWVGIDEAQLWFYSRMWAKLGIEHVQRWAQSRKARVDFTLVAQLRDMLESTVNELAQSHWEAQALISKEGKVFPFPVVMGLHNLFVGRERQFIAMFRYIRMQNFMGSTKASQKSFFGALNNFSVLGLCRDEGRIYNTGEYFTSPLIIEDQREKRAAYFRKLLTSDLLPLKTCSLCLGSGSAFSAVEISENAELRRILKLRADVSPGELVARCPCPVCQARGYVEDSEPVDVLEAHEWALRGWLGEDYLERVLAMYTDQPLVPVKKRGGWAARHDKN